MSVRNSNSPKANPNKLTKAQIKTKKESKKNAYSLPTTLASKQSLKPLFNPIAGP